MEFFNLFNFSKNKLPYVKNFNFQKLISDFEPKKGEKVKLWNKPAGSEVYVYLNKSFGGEGLVGKFNNRKIWNLLQDTEKKIDAEIIYFNKTIISIKVSVDIY